VLGRPVRVKLNSGTEYRGKKDDVPWVFVFKKNILNPPCFALAGVLACLDGYMNIAMEQTEEYVDGQLKAKYGDCFIRGNNGTFVDRIAVIER
jgi:U6 snRNA-associated Sm-like protein LSm6